MQEADSIFVCLDQSVVVDSCLSQSFCRRAEEVRGGESRASGFHIIKFDKFGADSRARGERI